MNNDKGPCLEDLISVKKICLILYEGSNFCIVCLDNFKEIFHGSDHKYTIWKGGGGGKK